MKSRYYTGAFLICPPRSGSNFVQLALSKIYEDSRHVAIYDQREEIISDALTVKSHAHSYTALLNEMSCHCPTLNYPHHFLILMRDPRLSAISMYEYSARAMGVSVSKFLNSSVYNPPYVGLRPLNCIDYYAAFTSNWLNTKSRGTTMLIRFEEFIQKPQEILYEVQNHLNLPFVCLENVDFRSLFSKISVELRERWKGKCGKLTKMSNRQKALPILQYIGEFHDLGQYKPIINKLENELADIIQELGYAKECGELKDS